MRRIVIFLLCCLLLTTAVSAESSITSMESNATISANGTCRMYVTFQLTVDSVNKKDLQFPLPGNARDISLNGSSAKTSRSDGQRWVDLSGVVYAPGTYSMTLQYSLPDLVRKNGKSGLVLEVPILSASSFRVENLKFSVRLPGKPEQRPTFLSKIYSEATDSYVDFSIEDAVISGQFTRTVFEKDTLTMKLPVSSKMFPQDIAKQWSLSYDDLIQYGLLLLALIYWIVFLRCKLPRPVRRVQAPDGITAGELGCCLSGQGVDFPMMIFSWAKMGYLTIELDRHQRVLLHKTMDMGNERSNLEMRWFKTLFGRRLTVDASSEHFARLSRKAGKTVLGSSHYFKKSSGNPLIFRALAAGIGAVAGYSLTVAFASDTVWQVVLGIFLIPLCAALSWLIQNGMRGISLRHRVSVYIAAGSCVLWILLGIWAGEAGVAVFVIVTQILAGLAAIHGGRRTEGGLQSRNEILGLRRYLRSANAKDLARILENNPEYFFDQLPDAMALGVDRAFARQFPNEKLGECPYLKIAGNEAMTPRQWNVQLRKVVQIVEEGERRMTLQKILNRR